MRLEYEPASRHRTLPLSRLIWSQQFGQPGLVFANRLSQIASAYLIDLPQPIRWVRPACGLFLSLSIRLRQNLALTVLYVPYLLKAFFHMASCSLRVEAVTYAKGIWYNFLLGRTFVPTGNTSNVHRPSWVVQERERSRVIHTGVEVDGVVPQLSPSSLLLSSLGLSDTQVYKP